MSSKPSSKRARDFAKVEENKERLRLISSEEIRARLARGYLTKDGAIAMRQVLEERGERQKD